MVKLKAVFAGQEQKRNPKLKATFVGRESAPVTSPQKGPPSLGAVKTLDRKLQERRDTNYQDVDRLRAQTAPMGLGAIKKLDQDLQAERDYAVYKTTGKLPGGEAGARTRVINTGWVKASVARDKAQEEVKRLQSEVRAPASSYLTGGAAQMATPYAVGAQAQKERQEQDSELGRAKAALKKAESELAARTDLWKDDQVQQAAAAVTKDPFAVTEALKKVREMPLDKLECRQAEQDVRGALYAAIAQSEEFKNWNYQDYHNVWDDDYYEKNPYDKYGMNLDITTSEAMSKAGETPVATEEEEKLLDFLIFKSHTDPAWRDNEDLTPNQYFQWWSTAISDPRVGKRWAEEAKEEGLWGGAKMVLNHAARSSEDALAGLIGLERSQGANAYAEAEYRDKLDGLGRVVFDAANTVADMAPSMAMGTALGPGAGLATMAASAGGRATEGALRKGHGRLESYGYGALTAASEAMLGRLLGGISKAGGGNGLVSNLVGKSAENINNGFLRFAAKVGLNSADEALEEYIQGVLDPVFRNIMLGEDNEVKLISEDAAYDAFMALITTPFLEGPTQAWAEVNQARALSDWGRQIQEMGPEVADTVLRAGLDSEASTQSHKLAEKLADQQAGGKAISDKSLGQLHQTILADKSTQKTASGVEAVKGLLVPFSEQERVNLSSGSRNKIVSGFKNLVKFVRDALSDGENIDRAYMGKLPDSVVSLVSEQAGIDVSGFSAMINGNDVRHIVKEHGDPVKEAAKGQIAVRAEDIAMIEQILAEPEQVKLSPHRDSKGRLVLEFSKTFAGRYVTLQAISDGKHLLQTDTMYIKKKKNPQDTGHNAADSDPVINAQSVPPQSSSTGSISQTAQDVNLKGRSLGDRVADATKRTLEEMARTEKKARFLKESKPLRDRLAQIQAESKAGMAQIEDRYGRAVADREPGTIQVKDGETAEQSKTELTKGEDGSTIGEQKGKKITAITDGAISRVPRVEVPGWTAEQCATVQQQHQELLRYARAKNQGKEVAFVFRPGDAEPKVFLGTDDSLDFGSSLYGTGLVVMHNHPGNHSFSDRDIYFALGHDGVRCLTIVKHDGGVEMLIKTNEYNSQKARIELDRLCKKHIATGSDAEITKAIDKFLRKGAGGFRWIRIDGC